MNIMFTSCWLYCTGRFCLKASENRHCRVVEHENALCSLLNRNKQLNGKRPLDRRIQRTLPLLQAALFHLIIERGYECITIADITEQANLGRTTFYLHYRDKEALLQESIKALLHDMHLDVELAMEKSCTYSTVSIRIFQHVAQRRQLYRAMLKEAGPTRMLEDAMRTYFTELCQRFLPKNSLNVESSSLVSSEILAVHATGSLLGLLTWWLNQEDSVSAEDIGTIYCRLMAKGNEDLLSSLSPLVPITRKQLYMA